MPRTRTVNITRIAEEAGLSIASVSRAMNGRSGVSEDVRRRVNQLLRKHNYVASSHLNREKKIAVISSADSFSNYVSALFDGLNAAAVEYGIEYCVINRGRNSRRSLLEDIREQQCSGALMILPSLFERELPELIDSELKLILIDQNSTCGNIGFIDNDSYSGAREAARHLIRLGHTRIGYLGFPLDTLNHIQRMKGYEHGLAEAGIVPEPGWVMSSGLSFEGNRQAAKELLSRHPELTAVMTSGDDIALGVLRAAWELGRKVPEQLSVVGFDDFECSACLTPALTTVHHPMREAAYRAMRELDLCLREPGRALPREILPTSLVIRESTGKCPVPAVDAKR